MKVHARMLLGIAVVAALFGSAFLLRRGAGSYSPLPKKRQTSAGLEASSSAPRPPAFRQALSLSGPVALGPTPDAIQERDGSYGFKGDTYAVTLGRDQVTIALPRKMERGRRTTLSLALEEIRRGDTVIANGGGLAPELRKADAAVIYRRGAVDERYILRKEALEQEFVIRELPAGSGDVVVSSTVQTEFTPPQEGTAAKELSFAGPGGSALRFSQAVALDASGRTLPLEMAYANGRLAMTVPASWLSEATLPIVVDPLVGGAFAIDANINGGGERADVSYCPTNNSWMVCWANSFGATSEEIYVQRVSAAGALLGTATLISNSPATDYEPSIAYSAAADRHLAVWWNQGATNTTVGRFINPDGTLPGSVFTISTAGGDQPAVAAAAGGGFLAIWRAGAALVSSSGTSTPVAVGAIGDWPRVASSNNEYMVIWEDNTGIAVRRVSATGSLLSPITYIAPNQGANANDIAGAGDRYLATWSASTQSQLKGRVILADGASTLSYASTEIPIYSPVAYYPASAFSATNNEWYTIHASGPTLSDLKGNTVSTTGAVSADAELIATPVTLYKPKVAWNSLTNEMLVVYLSTATSTVRLMAQRIALSGAAAVLEGRWNFDEGTGTVAHDSSGIGNDGALTGGVTWTAGKSGSAISLDGSGGYVEVPTVGMPAANASQSISWWMNYPSVPSGNQTVIGLTNDSAASAVQCGFRNGQVSVWNYGGGILAQALAPTPGVWHHFAYTYSGTIHRLYVDGVEAGTSTAAAQTAAPNKLEFGRWSGGSEYYAGLLDEVRIYGGTLTAAEIAALASDGALEAYLKFDEGAGATSRDSSGNGHSATLLTGASWSLGRSATALSLDGSSDSVSCVLGSGLPANNAPQTISWWMNYASVPGSVEAAVCLTNPTANSAVQTGFRNGQVSVWNWGGNTLVSAGAPQGGAWHHFAYTFDGSTHTLYVDGLAVNSSAVAPQTAAPSRFDLGFTPGWQERFQGSLDEVRIYSRSLSAGEILALAQAYSLEAYFKFDEGTGTTTADSTGNGHTGTFSGGTSWVVGKSGSAVSLDGSSGTVSCALGANLPANNAPQTISWWMNYAAPPQSVESMIGLTNSTAGSAVQCGFRNGQLTVWNWGGNTLVSTTAPSANSWHQASYTYDGTTHSLYVDGVLANSSTAGAQTAAPSRLDLGLTPGWGEYYAGILDEVRIYSRALTSAEIATLAQDPSLAAHFKFDEGSGLVAADSSGNGHSGTLSTAASWGQGVLGTGLQLDGSGYVSCSAGLGLPSTSSVQSIAWWMKVPSTPSTVQAVVGLTNPVTGSAVQVGYRNGQVTVWNWGGNALVSTAPPTPALWHHCAYTFDGATHTLYVDGASAATSTAAPQTGAPSRLDIGFTPGWGEYFIGVVDDVRIYTRALSASDVQGLIASAKPPAPVIVSPSTGSTLTQGRPPVSGTSSDSGLMISLLVDGTPNGTTVSGAGGAWLIYPATPISDGAHTFTAIATGVVGNSSPSAAVAVTISAASNSQLTVSSASIPDGGYVNNPQPAYSITLTNPNGTGIDSSTVVVHLDGAVVTFSITVIDANTVIVSFTPNAALTPGQHVVAIDGQTLGGAGISTVITTFVEDRSAPVVSSIRVSSGLPLTTRRPTVVAQADDTGGAGFASSAFSVTLNGVAIPSGQVQVVLSNSNNTAIATITPAADLADGPNVFSVRATDRAGNVSAAATLTLVFDNVPPGVAFNSPSDGDVLWVQELSLDVTVTDTDTGVVPGSIHVELNSVDVTANVTLTPSDYTDFGAPRTIKLTGQIGVQFGPNTLTVSATDAVGNSSVRSVSFTVSDDEMTPFLPPVLKVGLEIISGDGQTGMTGTPTSDSLVVRAYNQLVPGQSLDSIPISVQVVTGGGRAISDKTRSLLTDQQGRASWKHVFGPQPGPNTIVVSVIGQPEATPVTFVLTGRKPTLEDSTVRGLCNYSYSTADYQGSGLSRLFTIKAKKPDGGALSGQIIEPIVSEFNGAPPAATIGYFLPTRSITDSNGEATFAFVIDDNAPTGPFKMSFVLPSFIKEDGKQIAYDIAGEVLDPSTRPSAKIDGAGGTAGQGQIGVPGLRLRNALKAKDTDTQNRQFIVFSIVEGYGSFELDNGDIFFIQTDPCGNQVWYVYVDNDGKASVKFTPASQMVLVGIQGGHSDIYAVGRPEARLVSAQNPSAETSGFTFTQAEQVDASRQFLLETRVPIGLTSPITAMVDSKDLAGELVDTQGGVAPNSQSGISLAKVGSDPESRFDIYRSPAGQPLTAFERIYTTGEDVPTVGGGMRPLQVVEGGQLNITYTCANFSLQDLRREASFKRDRAFATVGADKFKVELEAVGKATLPNNGSYHWSLQVDDGAAQPLPNARNSILWMKIDAFAQDLNQDGLTNPVVLRVREINANRRARLTIRVQVDGLTANPELYDMAIVLSSSVLGDSPDWRPGIRLPRNAAELNQAYPLYLAYEKFFAPVTPANVATFQQKTGAPGLAVGQRLLWTEAPPDEIETTFASGFSLSSFTATDFTKPFEQANAKWAVSVLGTVLTPRSELTDWEDLQGTLDHEFFHTSGQQFKQRPPYGLSDEWRYDYSDTMFNFMKTNLWALEPQLRKDAVNEYKYGATLFIHNLMEIEAHSRFIQRVPTSNFMLRGDAGNLTRYLSKLAGLLRNGVPDTFGTMNTVGKNVTAAHRDQTLIPLMNSVWTLLPQLVRPLRGPEISLNDPEFNAKMPKATDVWIPKFKP